MKEKEPTHNKNAHLRHLADILELAIDIWKGTTFDLVGSNNNSLPRFRARFSSRDLAQVATLTTLHEARVNAANRSLVETRHVVTELRQKLVRLANFSS
jgi:hypothetical protein